MIRKHTTKAKKKERKMLLFCLGQLATDMSPSGFVVSIFGLKKNKIRSHVSEVLSDTYINPLS